MVQIKITSKAKKDIASIYKFILNDSSQNAEKVVGSIIKKIDTLQKQPDFGKIVKEFNKKSIRELKLYKYRIIYRVKSPSLVEIITVQHSARLLANNPNVKRYFKK